MGHPMDMGRESISTCSRVFREALHEKVTSEQSPKTREQSRPGPRGRSIPENVNKVEKFRSQE